MIAIKDVNYSINHKAILQNISIDIPKNQLTALIGPNGAGKSTLLSLISHLIPLQDGQIHIDHMDIKKTKYREMAKKVALFQQNIHLMNRLRVEELLILARFPYHQGWPNAKDKAICETMVDRFSLQKIRHRFLDTLSGGQRQRTLIAMVFTQDTPIILLDEPLNNLDMKHAKELMQSLQDAVEKENKTILLVLHDVNYASKYADYIVAMKNGCIDFYGQTTTVLTETNLGNLFNIPVSVKETTEQRLCLYY